MIKRSLLHLSLDVKPLLASLIVEFETFVHGADLILVESLVKGNVILVNRRVFIVILSLDVSFGKKFFTLNILFFHLDDGFVVLLDSVDLIVKQLLVFIAVFAIQRF